MGEEEVTGEEKEGMGEKVRREEEGRRVERGGIDAVLVSPSY